MYEAVEVGISKVCPWCGALPVVVDKGWMNSGHRLWAFVCPPEADCIKNLVVAFFGETKEEAIQAWETIK